MFVLTNELCMLGFNTINLNFEQNPNDGFQGAKCVYMVYLQIWKCYLINIMYFSFLEIFH